MSRMKIKTYQGGEVKEYPHKEECQVSEYPKKNWEDHRESCGGSGGRRKGR